jgi:hypothetical protein
MKYSLKSLQQFVNESNQGNVIDVILDAMEVTITEMLAATEEWFVKTFKQPFTDRDREFARINLTYDLIKAIETYTQPTDELVTINIRKSVKGNIEISAQIQRAGEVYSFSTEAIYAGGHNIQRLHYRYIVKTRLPKTGVNQITKQWSEKIKRLSKAEKLSNEIRNYTIRANKAREDAEENSRLKDDEILQAIKDDPKDTWYEWPTWEEIVKRDAAKNYNNDEEHYYRERDSSITRKIEFWKDMKIKSKIEYANNLEKEIKKMEAKLDAILK